MEKLEAFKPVDASNDDVVDGVTAKAYMEQFALKTFERAETTQRAIKATTSTLDEVKGISLMMSI
jgi:vacuolar protein sorting-associated protein VTA1